MKKQVILSLVLLIFLFVINFISYFFMPDRIVTHWDSKGVPDSTMPKLWGLLLIPLIALGIYLLFIFLPIIDPLKKNIYEFRNYYDSFLVLLLSFFFYVNLIILLWNFGIRLNIIIFLVPAIGFLFIYLGTIMKHIKQNWFIGIRTPWTLSDKNVWEKTHKLGGKLFIISGIIILLSGLLPYNFTVYGIIIPIVLSSIILIIYSYLEFKKIKK